MGIVGAKGGHRLHGRVRRRGGGGTALQPHDSASSGRAPRAIRGNQKQSGAIGHLMAHARSERLEHLLLSLGQNEGVRGEASQARLEHRRVPARHWMQSEVFRSNQKQPGEYLRACARHVVARELGGVQFHQKESEVR